MIYLYKYNGKKCCYDTASGAVSELTALQYKMLSALEPPMTPVCPTALRYELAKYDSEDVTEAYNELYALFTNGMIFGEENGIAHLRIQGDAAATSTDEAELIFAFARTAGIVKYRLSGQSENSEIISQIADKLGLSK